MAGIGDLVGANGVIQQLLLWNVVSQVVSAMAQPAFTALLQDAQSAHPEVALTPDVLAALAARHITDDATARHEATKSGMPPTSFDLIRQAATIRLAPADLATAVLRSYMTRGAAEAEARPQGITPEQFAIMADLAGDAPAPQQLAEALRRGIIARSGHGPDSTSFQQGIAETRLHDKWADTIAKLTVAVIAPADAADAVNRSYLSFAEGEREASKSGVEPALFRILADLAGDAPGAQQLAEALRRGIIPRAGRGADSVSFDQGIAETRLHNKWAPVIEALSATILSPHEAAEAVVRNFMTVREAESVAAESGVSAATLTIMRHLAGDAPGPQQLAEALRRGAIHATGKGADSTSFEQGIAEGRLADKWAPVIKTLAQIWPTPVNALDAVLKGQITLAEGRKLYERLGGDPEFFQVLFDTQGEAPTPLELGVLANRGDIAWDGIGPNVTSFAQGFHEGRWRNKWQDAYRKLAVYRPPESAVVTFLAHGIITDHEAAAEFARLGMDAETISRYIAEANFTAVSDYRGATVSMVLEAYHEQLLDATQATQLLEGFHVTRPAAQFMLDFEDAQRAFTAINNVVSRTRTLYAARKITRQTAENALHELGINPVQVTDIIKSWQIENSISVKVLSEAQIAGAFKEGLLTQPEAMTELENVGWTPFDAWLLLSHEVKQALPGKPSPGPAPPQGQVIPGTT